MYYAVAKNHQLAEANDLDATLFVKSPEEQQAEEEPPPEEERLSVEGEPLELESDPETEEKVVDTADPNAEAGEEDEDEEENNAKMTKTSDHLVTIWKDESTGIYRWLGVYSNKFRDDDRPAVLDRAESQL